MKEKFYSDRMQRSKFLEDLQELANISENIKKICYHANDGVQAGLDHVLEELVHEFYKNYQYLMEDEE